MSSIVTIGRAIAAAIQPMTGERASCSAIVYSTGAVEAELPRSAYALAVVDGKLRTDLVFKVGEGPQTAGQSSASNRDGWWRVTDAGTAVTFVSNIGGERYNLPAGTELQFDPPIAGISPRVQLVGAATGGTNPTWFAGVRNVVMYEQFSGVTTLDLFRSAVGAPPVVLVFWQSSEPSDGTTSPQTARETRLGTRKSKFKENFDILVIVNRKDSEHMRRLEGLTILDQLSNYLIDKQSVDGVVISSPSGLELRERFRESGQATAVYQEFNVYGVRVSAEHAIEQCDERTYNDWLTTWMVMPTPDDGTGRAPIDVVDVTFDMQLIYDGGGPTAVPSLELNGGEPVVAFESAVDGGAP